MIKLGRPRRISTRIIVAATAAAAAVLAVTTAVQFFERRAATLAAQGDHAAEMTATIDAALRDAMVKMDAGSLDNMVARLGALPSVRRMYLVDRAGSVTRSSEKDGAGKPADKADLARVQGAKAALRELRRAPDGRRYLFTLAPVPADKTCLSCHDGVKEGEPTGYIGLERWSDAETRAATRASLFVVFMSLAALVVIAVVLASVTRRITRPLVGMAEAATRIAAGDLDQSVTYRGDDEIGTLADAFRGMVGYLGDVAGAAGALAQGDLAVEVRPRSGKDAVAHNLDGALRALRRLIAETGKLTEAAAAGELAVRGDAAAFSGAYREVVLGLNRTLDTVVAPVRVAAASLARLASGEIPPRLDQAFAGEFDLIRRNLNTCVDAIDALALDSDRLLDGAAEGRFEVRADALRHRGEFARIVGGINRTLDTVVERVFWYEALLDAIPLPISVTDQEMRWTFVNRAALRLLGATRADVVGRSCQEWNTAICRTPNCGVLGLRCGRPRTVFEQAGQAFQADTSYLLDARGERVGHIEVLQDVTAAERVRTYLEAEVARVSTALERMAAGEFDVDLAVGAADEHTVAARASFERIAASVRGLGAAVSALAGDVESLTAAAQNGQLGVRADASAHAGAFRRLVEDINGTLDAVVLPLQAAAATIDRLARGERVGTVTESFAGDFDALKRNLNRLVAVERQRTADLETLIAAAADGRLETRIDTSGYEGAHGQLLDGVNRMLEGLARPFAVAADYVDRIARGDVPPRLEEPFRGAFDALRVNLNACVDAVDALVGDATALADAAVRGDLATRADASRHRGDFARIVLGIDRALDALLGPVSEAGDVLAQLAARDLTARMTGDYQGDHARIKAALNTAASNLDGSLQQVAVAADEVAHASAQIASGASAIAGGASEQAASLEEITASLQQMSSMARANAESARQARTVAGAALAGAGEGIRSMERLTGVIERIRTSSEQTARIVKTIDEIAFQTNLLALNAAVEAARAGDAGRGFAVVADEVRNLALRSAEAARNTAELIEGAVRNAEAGVAANEDVRRALSAINGDAQRVSDIIGEIAAATEQQTGGIQQVGAAVDQMNQLTQAAAANSEESASIAEELASQADEVRGLVGGFTISR